MIKQIKDIFYGQIKDKVEEYETVQTEIEKAKDELEKIEKDLEESWKEVEKAENALIVPKKFTFFQKWIFKRKEYKEDKRLSEESKKRLELKEREYNELSEKLDKLSLEAKIEKLKHYLPQLQSYRDKFENIKAAMTIKDLGLSFDEASNLLTNNNMTLVLDENDKVITENEADFDKKEDFILVHKTKYAPSDSEIKSPAYAKAKTKVTYLFDEGEEFEYDFLNSRNTVHFTQNGEVSSHMYGNFDNRKYAVLLPFKDFKNQNNLCSFSPEDTYVDYKVDIIDGYILCPKDEMETIKKMNPGVNIIGYEGESVDGYADSLLSILGYKFESIGMHSWSDDFDIHKHAKFMNENGNLKYKTHAYSEEGYRDRLIEYLNIIIGFLQTIENYNKTGKKCDIKKLTKVLFSDSSEYIVESGDAKVDGKGKSAYTPRFSEIINNCINPYKANDEKGIYLRNILITENIENSFNDPIVSNAHFVFDILAKKFGIQLSDNIKTLLLYSEENKMEDFVDKIEDIEIKNFMNGMISEGVLSKGDRYGMDDAKDILFIKSVIDEVYKEEKNTFKDNSTDKNNETQDNTEEGR